jgi:hypothetical protein
MIRIDTARLEDAGLVSGSNVGSGTGDALVVGTGAALIVSRSVEVGATVVSGSEDVVEASATVVDVSVSGVVDAVGGRRTVVFGIGRTVGTGCTGGGVAGGVVTGSVGVGVVGGVVSTVVGGVVSTVVGGVVSIVVVGSSAAATPIVDAASTMPTSTLTMPLPTVCAEDLELTAQILDRDPTGSLEPSSFWGWNHIASDVFSAPEAANVSRRRWCGRRACG